jgi:N-methylhydantoinase A/oxoprolinase/acetone carboxylase beta subunit
VGVYIGVDVGGTNTDAAALSSSDRNVVAAVKSPTTPDVASGVVASIEQLLRTSDIRATDVDAVMIGTTHFMNALVEARELLPTAVIRLCGTATRSLPPMIDWPNRLRSLIGDNVFMAAGGIEFDGRDIAAIDDEEIVRIAERITTAGLTTAAITSVFSPVDSAHEQLVAERLQELVSGLRISISSQIGRIGLLERENATIINASLRGLADRVLSGFERSVASLGIHAPLYLSQNDGTLRDCEHTNRYPVATFASGPTNSMRGAAFLSGELDAAVIDVGGTTSDIGFLRQGFPREAALSVKVAGVRTNFRMPDVMSLGLGGGSLVHIGPDGLTVGPDSVGYRITSEALVFGGNTLTATDIAVAAGHAEIGNPLLVAGLDSGMVAEAVSWMREHVGLALDRMKTSPAPVPVILVGGGSAIFGGEVPGASRILVPENAAVANAVGAAIAQVGGQVDHVASLVDIDRVQMLDNVRREAIARCVAAGADESTVRVVDVEEIPLAYLPSNAVRIMVKAVGDLLPVSHR